MKLYKQNSEYSLVVGGQTYYSDGGQPKLDRLQIETIVDPNAPDMSEWDVEVEIIKPRPYYFSSPCTTIKITKIKPRMEFENFKKTFDESFGRLTPTQFVLKMKGLGYEFIDVPTPITTEELESLSNTIIQALNRFGVTHGKSFGLPVLTRSYEMIKMVSLIINANALKPNHHSSEVEILKSALREMVKESEDLMDYCIDRKHLYIDDETDGQKSFALAKQQALKYL